MAGALFSDAVISFFVNTAAAEQSLTSFTRKFSTGVGQLKSLVAGFVEIGESFEDAVRIQFVNPTG